jgi:hypothetical protein
MMQRSVSIFCVPTPSGRSIHVWPEIVDVAPRFTMCVDQVVSQVEPIHRRKPRGVVRVMQGNLSHGSEGSNVGGAATGRFLA